MSITSSFTKDLLKKLPFKPGNVKQLYRSKKTNHIVQKLVQAKRINPTNYTIFQGLAKVETEKGLPISLMSSQKRYLSTHNQSPLVHSTTEAADIKGFPIPHISIEVSHKLTSSKGSKVTINSSNIKEFSERIWNKNTTEVKYQPGYVVDLFIFEDLDGIEKETLNTFGMLAREGSDYIYGKKEETFQQKVKELGQQHLYIDDVIIKAINSYLKETNETFKQHKAEIINNIFIAAGWVEKYWSFEPYNKTGQAENFIPKYIATPYELLSKIVGRHTEYTYYDHYVGASCRNIEDTDKLAKKVDFKNQEQIIKWVQSFRPLYTFQDETGDPAAFEAENYFRFVHLAMEKRYSYYIPQIEDNFRQAIKETNHEKKVSLIQKGFELVLQAQTEMNTIFNTGYQGSAPKLYNTHIRSWIAGTNGDNIGTVFPDVKCMEGCGNEIAFFEGKEVTNVKKGVYPGQTGAGTSAIPILDEYAGGRELYDQFSFKDIIIDYEKAILKDDQQSLSRLEKEFKKHLNPMDYMLLQFRMGGTRPISHNQKIIEAKKIHEQLKSIIEKNPQLVFAQLASKVISLKHRIDHYKVVQIYINEGQRSTGKQQKSTATGGSKTPQFLYKLIQEDHEGAKVLIKLLDEFDTSTFTADQKATKEKIQNYLIDSKRVADNIQQQSQKIMDQEAAEVKHL